MCFSWERAPAIFCVRSPKTTPYNVYFLSLTVSVGEVYTFKHLRIRENDGEENGRILNTTLHPIQTVITQAENLSGERRCAFNDVALLEADGENHQHMEPNIDNIDSIEELSHFKQRSKCQKKNSSR